MKIRDFENNQIYERRLFSLGNFSAITGKSKSKKSFFAAMLLAAAAKNGLIENKLNGFLPTSKNGVLLFDTEQSNYDVYRYAKNVLDVIGHKADNFGAFALMEYTPKERCEIIDHAITKYKDNVSYIVIDGIADLATAINDELEATRVVSLLMKWTKLYNNHITVNIHQNKNDNFATGHLGSLILKKAEAIISVFKDEKDSMVSKVECTDIRGTAEFKDFEIEIQETGIPKLRENFYIPTHYNTVEREF
jgi:KaiC/GvpD/RAD55 family RecA-like ATPase